MLRNLLSRYLSTSSSDLQFSYNQFGKPFLANASVNFNLSHTSDYAAFAIAEGVEVGIDVEKIVALPDALEIAKEFLPSDFLHLILLPPDEQTRAFYYLWTRHEAVVKALGLGLGHGLGTYTFEQKSMQVEAVSLSNEYSCHLAYTGKPRTTSINFYENDS
jgi:4'-phosphopantetheinyl transferase